MNNNNDTFFAHLLHDGHCAKHITYIIPIYSTLNIYKVLEGAPAYI